MHFLPRQAEWGSQKCWLQTRSSREENVHSSLSCPRLPSVTLVILMSSQNRQETWVFPSPVQALHQPLDARMRGWEALHQPPKAINILWGWGLVCRFPEPSTVCHTDGLSHHSVLKKLVGSYGNDSVKFLRTKIKWCEKAKKLARGTKHVYFWKTSSAWLLGAFPKAGKS